MSKFMGPILLVGLSNHAVFGKVCAFKIFLPTVQPPEARSAEAEATPTIRGGTETILLVEDQPEVRAILGTFVRSLGYDVLEAGSGDDALRIIKRRRRIDILAHACELAKSHQGRQILVDQGNQNRFSLGS